MVIYKTTNKVNGKFYVGKDEANNPNYLGSGYMLKSAIEKYGKENFEKEILEVCKNSKHLQEREIYWIAKLNALDHNLAYNIAEGGTGGNTYKGKSESEMLEIKAKISKAGKNREFSEEHRRKLSESAKKRKGNKPCKFKGMKYEDYMDPEKAAEIRKRVSEGAKRPMTEETKQKLRNNGGKSVIVNGITYISISEARRETGLSYNKIISLL
jgi:group I intron endonuclease